MSNGSCDVPATVIPVLDDDGCRAVLSAASEEPIVGIDRRATSTLTDHTRTPRVSTDGGTPIEESQSSSKQRRLSQIFEEVTGTVQFVETEKQSTGSRYAGSDRHPTVSEYVTAAAREDGLSDAITTPEFDADAE